MRGFYFSSESPPIHKEWPPGIITCTVQGGHVRLSHASADIDFRELKHAVRTREIKTGFFHLAGPVSIFSFVFQAGGLVSFYFRKGNCGNIKSRQSGSSSFRICLL